MKSSKERGRDDGYIVTPSLTITNLTVPSSKACEMVEGLTNGSLFGIDRFYALKSIPDHHLQCIAYL